MLLPALLSSVSSIAAVHFNTTSQTLFYQDFSHYVKIVFMTTLVYPKIFVFVGEQEKKDLYKIINMYNSALKV